MDATLSPQAILGILFIDRHVSNVGVRKCLVVLNDGSSVQLQKRLDNGSGESIEDIQPDSIFVRAAKKQYIQPYTEAIISTNGQ